MNATSDTCQPSTGIGTASVSDFHADSVVASATGVPPTANESSHTPGSATAESVM